MLGYPTRLDDEYMVGNKMRYNSGNMIVCFDTNDARVVCAMLAYPTKLDVLYLVGNKKIQFW
jgi:uncharacterized membrane protein (UPF0127 family)